MKIRELFEGLSPTLVKIGEFMRKNGMRNAKDLADFLVDKWSTR